MRSKPLSDIFLQDKLEIFGVSILVLFEKNFVSQPEPSIMHGCS